jgi:hypothetical protein
MRRKSFDSLLPAAMLAVTAPGAAAACVAGARWYVGAAIGLAVALLPLLGAD